MYLGLAYIRRGEYGKAEAILKEDRTVPKTGGSANIAYSLQALGIIACYQKDYFKARSLYTESLQLLLHRRHKADRVDIAECIISIGRFGAAQGLYEKIRLLLGGAEAIVPDIDKKTYALFLNETQKFITSAHDALGNEAYNAAYEAGKQMSLDEAVAYVWKELGQSTAPSQHNEMILYRAAGVTSSPYDHGFCPSRG